MYKYQNFWYGNVANDVKEIDITGHVNASRTVPKGVSEESESKEEYAQSLHGFRYTAVTVCGESLCVRRVVHGGEQKRPFSGTNERLYSYY